MELDERIQLNINDILKLLNAFKNLLTDCFIIFLQIVWFLKELMKNSVNGAESVCHSLLRQIAGLKFFSIILFLCLMIFNKLSYLSLTCLFASVVQQTTFVSLSYCW